MPPRLLTNADLEKLVETTNEWIMQRTGIRERHIVDPGVATSDLAQGGRDRGHRARRADARRHRPHHRRHRHARHAVSEHGVPGAGQDRRDARLGLRPVGGVLGVHLFADGRQPDGRRRRRQPRAGHRRRRDVEHHRLHRSRHLRAVRRRRRRGGARACPTTAVRHPRLRAPGGRQRRTGAVHAGRRQPAARPRTRRSISACTT